MKRFKKEYAHHYYLQISSQCEYAIEAMRQLQVLFRPNEIDDSFRSNSQVFMLATTFVSSVANIDKMFNGSKNTRFIQERTQFLQSAFLGVHNKLPSRKIRNSIEHLDEKIDEAVMHTTFLFDHRVIITPFKFDISKGNYAPSTKNIFRHLIYVTSKSEFHLQFHGDEMNLTEVDLTIREIKERCDELQFAHLRPNN